MTRRVSPVAGRTFPWQGLDQERRNALLLYALIGFVVLFAFVLIGWGYYKDRIAPNHETVLEVAGRRFDVAFIERRAQANLRAQNFAPSATLQDLVVSTVQAVELEEITRRIGQDRGIQVTNADIDDEIRKRLGLPEDIARNDFAAAYRREILRVGLPVKEYREIVAAQIIQMRLEQQYKEPLPAEDEQVDAQILRVATESKAQEAKQRVEKGELFSLVAVDLSIDPSKQNAGQLGWVTRAEVDPKLVDALFTLPVGRVSDPIEDSDGWWLAFPRGREVRAIDEAQKQRIAAKLFDNQVRETRDKLGSSTRLTQDQITLIGKHVLDNSR